MGLVFFVLRVWFGFKEFGFEVTVRLTTGFTRVHPIEPPFLSLGLLFRMLV